MSIREISGLVYRPLPCNSKGMCVLCGLYGVRCEARVTPKPRAKYVPGVVICGWCWEDRAEAEIRTAVGSESSKHPTSFKLTDTALDILSTLASKRGIAKSALIENLLRDEYQREVAIRRPRDLQAASSRDGR